MGEPATHQEADVIRPLAFQSDAELVADVRRGDAGAKRRLFEKYAPHVARVLTRCLGAHPDNADLLHDVFVCALRDIGRIRDPGALKGWLAAIAVHSARGWLRHKRRRRWLQFFAPEELPDPPALVVDGDTRDAVRAAYRILDTMPDDERVAFALRFIDQMELTEVAAACETSLATIKRRLTRAQAEFVSKAQNNEHLKPWLDDGRWGDA